MAVMFLDLFEADRYFFNPYSLPLLATCACLLWMLALLTLHGLAPHIRIPLTLIIFATTIWLFSFHWMYSSRTEDDALAWAKRAYLGVPFIAVATYDLAVRVRGVYEEQKLFVRMAWLTSALFAFLAFDSDLIARVARLPWGFYPLYGHLGVVFVGYFVLIAAGGLWHLFPAWQGAASRDEGRPVQLMAIGTVVGYIGGVDFIPKLGPPIYPFGYFCVLASTVLVAYGLTERVRASQPVGHSPAHSDADAAPRQSTHSADAPLVATDRMQHLEAILRQHNAQLLEGRADVADASERDVALQAYLLEKYGPEAIPGLVAKARELNEQVYEEIARAEGLM